MIQLPERADFDVIAGWVQPGERVLDLGCGNGALLRQLIDTRGACGYGVEIEDAKVLAAIQNGINVLQSDLEGGLAIFTDDAFDHVVLSRTLQTVRNTQAILLDMLRVGREAVVSFPNFGYWKNRMAVMAGRMPVSKTCLTHGTTRPICVSSPCSTSKTSASNSASSSATVRCWTNKGSASPKNTISSAALPSTV